MKPNSERVGVVGGGLAGLSAACTLAGRGHQVVLFERNSWLGGKATVLREAGFRFDMGPTILTLPEVLDRVFAEAGLRTEDELDLVRLDPQWRCFFVDGSHLDLVEQTEPMAQRLAEWAPGAGLEGGYRRFMRLSEELHAISDRYFFWRPIGTLRDLLGGSGMFSLSGLRSFLQMRPGRTVAGTVRRCLPERRTAQMADHFTQYVGSSPFRAPAVLCGIAHMQTDRGVWYPRGGIGRVPEALSGLAAELGVEVRLETEVSQILIEDGRATGVRTQDGETIPLAAVVSNCDAVRTYRELVGGEPAAEFEKVRGYEPACSGVVLYLGLDRSFDQLLHHCLAFSRDAEEEFDAIYGRGEPAPDPTCYICAPARTDPTVAPEGGEALYVLAHTPYLRPEHDWSAMFSDYREAILRKLETTAGLDGLRDHIVFESALTPVDIDRRYRVLDGAIYGLASHGRWSGAFKPNNASPYVDRLYLAGGAAHPGPGMPMVLMSGWIAADALDGDASARERRTDGG